MPTKYKVSEKNGDATQSGSTSNIANGTSYGEKSSDKPEVEERGEWANKWEFILSCIGLSVGLGNIWRFPYLAYANGGAAFVVAYIVLQMLIGKPMYFMELVLGQYSGKGPTTVWALNPSGKGIGISQAIISLIVAIYYNVIMAYCLYYMFASMQGTLPWTVCKENGDATQNGSTSNISNGTSYDQEGSDKPEVEERGEWANKWEFILSCIGLSVGLGNIWRFPYLAYANGGAAFVVAYIVLQMLIGKPMYFLELVLGQYSGKGPTTVWALNPSGKGIGISQAIISLIVAIYYNVIMAYCLYYMFASMQGTLPWTVCKEEWKQFGCVEKTTKPLRYCNPDKNITEDCRCTLNATIDVYPFVNCTNVSYIGNPTAVAELYFYNEVIQKAPNMYPKDMGDPLWKLALCLLLSWIVVIVCIIKGIKSSGKVVYFSATFPYIILLILLIRGCTLDGAIDGVIYFAVPKWEKLLDIKVWVAAAGQMFLSLGVSFGGIIMFGSFTKFRNNAYRDAVLISSCDLLTSIIAGFVIFTTFGGMAKVLGVDVQAAAKGGYGVAFVAYPEALSNLSPPQLWSIIFFFMLFTLGLNSQFALLETTLTCIHDEYPRLRKYKSYMCIGFGAACYLIALTCITPGGDYVVELLDVYGSDFAVLFVASCECVAVFWVYGIRNFFHDVKYMLGRSPRPAWYWIFCWLFCSPVLNGRLKTITTPTTEWGPNDKSKKQEIQLDYIANDSKYGVDTQINTVDVNETNTF